MQVQKEEIQNKILMAAETIFLRKGFHKTTMRDIAKAAEVGLSNIYNYYRNKDEIYREILQPVISHLYRKIYEHNAEKTTLDVFTSTSYLKQEVNDYIKLAEDYRHQLKLLLFKSQGSSLENFREQYTDLMTDTIHIYLDGLKRKYPHINIQVTDFFIHLNTSWLFAMLEELVMHHIKKKEKERFITEYIRFETAGWKELMHA